MKKLSHLMKMKLKCFSQMKNRYLHLQRGLTYKLDKNNENEKGPAYSFVRITNRSEYRPYGKDENSLTILRNSNGQIIKMTEKIPTT